MSACESVYTRFWSNTLLDAQSCRISTRWWTVIHHGARVDTYLDSAERYALEILLDAVQSHTGPANELGMAGKTEH